MAFGGLETATCKKLDTCNFDDAFNLALGIGIQVLSFFLLRRYSGRSINLPPQCASRGVFLCACLICCACHVTPAELSGRAGGVDASEALRCEEGGADDGRRGEG